MFRTSLRTGVATLALATLVAAGMTAAPFSLSDDLSLKAKNAEARGGNGGGNDNGGRGGNDKGGKGGNDKGGKGGNSANAGTSTSSLDATEEETEETEETAKKNGWGSLSASNASQRAREMAADGSQVNNIADYEAAVNANDLNAAAEALAAASNKEITPEAVARVNANIEAETELTDEDIATAAEAIRSGEVEPAGEGEGEESAEGEGEGDGTEEGVDEIAAAAEELIGEDEGDTSTQ